MQVNFGKISEKDVGKSMKIDVTRGDVPKMDLKLLSGNVHGFKAELRTIEPGEHYELKVTLIGPLPEKRLIENLTLETGVAEASTVSVRVYASVTPHLSAKPPFFRVPGERDSDWEQSVRLEWDDKAPHKVLGVTVEDPKLKVDVEEKHGAHLVVLHVPKDYQPQPRGLSVTVRTDDSKVPVFTVPVYAVKTPRSNRTSGISRTPVGGAKVTGKNPNTAKPMTSKPKAVAPGEAKTGAAKPKPDSGGSGS